MQLKEIRRLDRVVLDCRKMVLKMIHRAQTSHIGSNFSCTEIMTVLFEKILDVDKKLKEDRDRFVLSAGWKAATLYYFLAKKRIIPPSALGSYCSDGSKYIGLAEPNVRGVEFAGGSMGMGLAAGVGFALAKKLKKEKGRVIVLESDGALDCGMVWEAALMASHHQLDNLTLVIDNNGWQAMGRKADVLNVEPLTDKFKAFGWQVSRVNGHDIAKLLDVLGDEWTRPHIVIADTVKGKGVKFMEDNNLYHYWHISKDAYNLAMHDLCRK